MKIKDDDPQTPPSPGIFCPFICMPLITSLQKKQDGSSSHACPLYLWECFLCLNKLSLYFLFFFFFSHFTFLTSLHCLWIPLHKERILHSLGISPLLPTRWIDRPLVIVNYKLALAKSIANDWTTRDLPFASLETEPCASAAVDLQHPWGSSGRSETLCDPGNMVGQVLDSWIFLGKDFMIPIPASPYI